MWGPRRSSSRPRERRGGVQQTKPLRSIQVEDLAKFVEGIEKPGELFNPVVASEAFVAVGEVLIDEMRGCSEHEMFEFMGAGASEAL